MNNVINIAEKFAVDLRKESWANNCEHQKKWTKQEYIGAYMKMLSKQIRNR